jgi:LysR family transcriptional activator of nhaA
MRHPNYNHLLYFWAVVHEGGIAQAAEALHVTPQTISGQLRLLAEEFGGQLFEKKGRRLTPTDLGRVVYEYADEIFSRGQELASVMRGASPLERRNVTIGITDVVPRLVAWRVLAPLMLRDQPYRVTCRAGTLEALVAELATHRLDLVLSTSALPSDAGIRAFNHLLGESDISFFAAPRLARRLSREFPESLHLAPMLLPTPRSANRRVLDAWFAQAGITPTVVGEFDDSALVKTVGQGGVGVFTAPAAIEDEVTRQFQVRVIGRTGGMRARFYAISTERRIKHPAVVEITERARTDVFRAPAGARPGDGP